MPLILTLLALGLASLAVLWLLQRRLIYFPSTEPAPPASSVLPMADEVSFETDDHVRLGAWFVRPSGPGRATVLVFNGNAGDRSYRAPLAEALAEHGLGVLLFDYRGYGGNP